MRPSRPGAGGRGDQSAASVRVGFGLGMACGLPIAGVAEPSRLITYFQGTVMLLSCSDIQHGRICSQIRPAK